MTNEKLGWHATVRGSLSVLRNGLELGRCPNRMTGVLLTVLVSRIGSWSARSELAIRLYPDVPPACAKTAFRQCLLRLKNWVGEEAIECEPGRIRLASSLWTTDFGGLESGPDTVVITPELHHPWLDELRARCRVNESNLELSAPVSSFQAVVEETAQLDRDAARALLIGGSLLAESLPLEVVAKLLSLTLPKDRRDPMACEYLELLGFIHLRNGQIAEFLATYFRAHRLAVHRRDAAAIARTHAFVLFSMLEAGDLALAREWCLRMPTGRGSDAAHLLLETAQAAYYWNAGKMDEAIDCMQRSASTIKGTDRLHRVHYWRNYAVLCAEAGHVEASEEAENCCREVLVPQVDICAGLTLELARGTRLIAQKRAEEAAMVLSDLADKAKQTGWAMTALYAQEALAEALANSGETRRPAQIWKNSEGTRKQMGGRPTPRIAARRARLRELQLRW